MSNNKAFVKQIGAFGSGTGEDESVHQTSPAWVLTFVRWEVRDTLRTKSNGSLTSRSVRDPLVVENDCIQANVVVSKGALTPSFSATLVQTDVNYMTAVAPGDFVFVNMLNWENDARAVANKARAKQPINGPIDGFKGVFKVQSVRKIVQVVDPEKGTKVVLFKVTGFAFTELNNTIYFNQHLIDASEENYALFVSNLGNDWALTVSNKGMTNVQDIMKTLIESFIGTGLQDNGKLPQFGLLKTANTHFYMPQLVGSLLGVSGAQAAKDIYVFLFGVQHYAAGSAQSMAAGMNPTLGETNGRFYFTNNKCQGETLLKCEYWNQVKAWSILNQFTNAPLNELYTCFRISPSNKVMPTLVFRQIPFTTDDFQNSIPVTSFMNIPRWKVSPALAFSVDVGRDEAARVNFVQFFGRSTIGKDTGFDISSEVAQGNYVFDKGDVERSGLRPYIINSQFDEIVANKSQYLSPEWAKIVGNALVGGHMKINGTIEFAGIVEPIAAGDNLEFDGVVYHIEQVAHQVSINPMDGKRIFRTTVSLSSGVSTRSTEDGLMYSEMTYPNAHSFRQNDAGGAIILPGVSESQDVVYRTGNPETNDTPATNNPFVQPNGGAKQPPSVRGLASKLPSLPKLPKVPKLPKIPKGFKF